MDLNDILSSGDRVKNIIKEDMLEIKKKYGDERKTEVDMTAIDYIDDESLIPVEKITIALSKKGYIKRILTDTFRTQNRGGVGIKGMSTNEDDYVDKLVTMETHDSILFFTNKGKVYRMKGYEVPCFSRQSKGIPIINLLQLEKDEEINSIISLNNDDNSDYLVFITKNGLIKRTNVREFDSIRKTGKIAIILKENDYLISVRKTSGNNEIIIGASNGRMVRFNENEVRVMGRVTSGVRGIDLNNAYVVGAEVVNDNDQVLIVTENGYGKKTDINQYRLTHRGSKGVKALNITEKNGNMVCLKTLNEELDLLITTNNGVIIRISTNQISTLNRNTQGVRLINLKELQKVSNITLINNQDDSFDANDN